MPLSDARLAFNFVFGTLILGSVAATVLVFLPFLLAYSAIHGFSMPPPSPSNAVLRTVQIIEAYVICHVGSILAAKRIRVHLSLENVRSVRWRSLLWALAIPSLCLMAIICIAIPKYGLTFAVMFNGTLIFGSFTVLFLGFTVHAFNDLIDFATQQDARAEALNRSTQL